MILLNDILVDEEILTAEFSCDLSKCKGACCTFPGDYGAPVTNTEVQLMLISLEAASKYLSHKSKKIIDKEGIVQGSPGNYTTTCINKKDCVFVYYEGKIALCALEKAFIEGETTFRKPLSCHLFPIRVRQYEKDYLYYSKIEECLPALKQGKKLSTALTETVREALERAYGKKWVELLSSYVASLKIRE